MACSKCGSDIPLKQEICPRCYDSARSHPKREGKQNVMWFVPGQRASESFVRWTRKFLQPESVGYNFYADTDNALEEITRNSSGMWTVLFLDERSAASAVVDKFRSNNPNCLIAIFGDEIPPSAPPNAVFLRPPRNDEEFLAMTHNLFVVR